MRDNFLSPLNFLCVVFQPVFFVKESAMWQRDSSGVYQLNIQIKYCFVYVLKNHIAQFSTIIVIPC